MSYFNVEEAGDGMTSTRVSAETSTSASAPAGASDESLLRRFREHVEGEQGRVEAYVDLARWSPEDVGYLVQLIFEDGARNHRLFLEMINRIRSDIDGREREPRLPSRGDTSVCRDRLVKTTQRLMELEAEDESALEALHQEFGSRPEPTFLSLLLELMQVDAKKHIRILEAIRSQLGGMPGPLHPVAVDLRARS